MQREGAGAPWQRLHVTAYRLRTDLAVPTFLTSAAAAVRRAAAVTIVVAAAGCGVPADTGSAAAADSGAAAAAADALPQVPFYAPQAAGRSVALDTVAAASGAVLDVVDADRDAARIADDVRAGTADEAAPVTHAALTVLLRSLEEQTAASLFPSLAVGAAGRVDSSGVVTSTGVDDVDGIVAQMPSAADSVVFVAASDDSRLIDPHRPGFDSRQVDGDQPVGVSLGTENYRRAGEQAAAADARAVVRVTDVRQTLAFVCGYTADEQVCTVDAAVSAEPLRSARPGTFGVDGDFDPSTVENTPRYGPM